MKPAARRRVQGGVAAVELAVILSATLFLMPTVALFAKVFFQYSVIKSATRDAAAYMASLPPAAIKDNTERARAFAIAARMVSDAAVGAGLNGSTTVAPAMIECDNYPCFGLVPDAFVVKATLSINDEQFNAFTGAWTDAASKTWQVNAQSTIPVSK